MNDAPWYSYTRWPFFECMLCAKHSSRHFAYMFLVGIRTSVWTYWNLLPLFLCLTLLFSVAKSCFFIFKIYFWLCWVFAATWALLKLWREGAALLGGAWASRVVVVLLLSTGSRVFRSCHLWSLEHWLCSCGAQAWLLCNMWHLPRPGIEPTWPALAGSFCPQKGL